MKDEGEKYKRGYLGILDAIGESTEKLPEKLQEKALVGEATAKRKLAKGLWITERNKGNRFHRMQVNSAHAMIKPWDLCGWTMIGGRYGRTARQMRRIKKAVLPGMGAFPYDHWGRWDWTCTNSATPWMREYEKRVKRVRKQKYYTDVRPYYP